MKHYRHGQSGISLIVSLILLVTLMLMVISGVRGTTLNERMSGSNMERTRAYQAAEQALQQGMVALRDDGDACLTACTAGAGIGASTNTVPAAWSGTSAKTVTLATNQQTTASYVINQLTGGTLPAGKTSCVAYSVMGRGQGRNAEAVAVLQTVAFVCPVD